MPNHEAVQIGFETSDDSAVVNLKDGTTIIQTVDFFTPVVDDPYHFGQIAAANALSDIYAMGGDPLFALNIVGFPINDLPKSILTEILQGGIDKASEAGIPIVGGHSVDDKEPKYGMAVTGEINKKKIWKNSGVSAGDLIILTKALGTGVLASGIKKELVSKENIEIAIASMSSLNKDAADILKQFNPSAVTDISGFGLLGHLKEVCENSNATAIIDFSKLKFLPGTRALAGSGIIPGGTRRNYDYIKDFCEFNSTLSPVDHLLAADAQTSGGLLIALNEVEAKKFIYSYNKDSAIIGVVEPRGKNLIKII